MSKLQAKLIIPILQVQWGGVMEVEAMHPLLAIHGDVNEYSISHGGLGGGEDKGKGKGKL